MTAGAQVPGWLCSCRLLALALPLLAPPCALGAEWAQGLFAPEATQRVGRDAPGVLIRNATLLDGRDEIHRSVDISLRDGKVDRISSSLSPRGGDLVVEGRDLWVTPGLVDLGFTVPLSPRPRSGDGPPFVQDFLDGRDIALQTAVSGGVTRVLASLEVDGFSVATLISTLRAPVLSRMRLPGVPSALVFRCDGGLAPLRLAQVAPDSLDPILQSALKGVSEQKMPLVIHCDDSEMLESALEIAGSAGFPVRGVVSREAHGIARDLAARGICVSVPWGQRPGIKASPLAAPLVDAARGRRGCAAVSSGTLGNIGHLNRLAAYARGVGVNNDLEIPQERAIAWVTSNPARLVAAQGEVGVLARGRRADLVVWQGNPFAARSRPEYVFIDGLVAQLPLPDRGQPGPSGAAPPAAEGEP